MIAMKVSFACARGRSAAACFKFPGGEGRVDARHRHMRGLEIQYGVEVRAFSRVERLLGVAVGASRPIGEGPRHRFDRSRESVVLDHLVDEPEFLGRGRIEAFAQEIKAPRSEEHTSELQSLMRISYVVFCLNKNII